MFRETFLSCKNSVYHFQVKSFPLVLGKACKLWGPATWEYEELPMPPHWKPHSLLSIPGGFKLVLEGKKTVGCVSLETLGSL